MLYRKVQPLITDYFASNTDKVLVVTGARQIGKSYIIRYCAERYKRHVAISRFMSTEEYGIKCAYILSNSNEV